MHELGPGEILGCNVETGEVKAFTTDEFADPTRQDKPVAPTDSTGHHEGTKGSSEYPYDGDGSDDDGGYGGGTQW